MKEKTTIIIPNSFLDKTKSPECYVKDYYIEKYGIYKKKCTLKELMDFKTSHEEKINNKIKYLVELEALDESEFKDAVELINVLNFNVIIMKEAINYTNQPAKIDIFSKSFENSKINSLYKRIASNLEDEGTNLPFAGRVRDLISLSEINIKDFEQKLDLFNNEVEVSVDLLNLTAKNTKEDEPKKNKKNQKGKSN